MNERIRLFAEQAGSVTFGGKICLFGDQDIEKFAKLIAKECADIAYKTSWDALVHEYGQSVIPLHLYNTIKQRYGVEE